MNKINEQGAKSNTQQAKTNKQRATSKMFSLMVLSFMIYLIKNDKPEQLLYIIFKYIYFKETV